MPVSSAIHKYQLYPFWNDEYKNLEYINEEFNDTQSTMLWIKQGYPNRFTGNMCDMRHPQPSWNQRFIEIFQGQGWKNIGTSYYCMETGTVLPTHKDLYLKYINLFNLQGREQTIRRAIVFLEEWKPGHYFEANGAALINWKAGQVVEWAYDTPHMAANIGLDPRYTLQITGHVND